MSIPSTLEYRILDARVVDPSAIGNPGTNGSTPVTPSPLNITLKGATGTIGVTPTQVNGLPGTLPTNPIQTHIGHTGLVQLGSAASPGQDGAVGPAAPPALQGVSGDPYTFSSGIVISSGVATVLYTGWYEIVQNGQVFTPILVDSMRTTTRIFNADGIVSGNSQVWSGLLYAGDKVTMALDMQITRIA